MCVGKRQCRPRGWAPYTLGVNRSVLKVPVLQHEEQVRGQHLLVGRDDVTALGPAPPSPNAPTLAVLVPW